MLNISGEHKTDGSAKNVANLDRYSGLFTKDLRFQSLTDWFMSSLRWKLEDQGKLQQPQQGCSSDPKNTSYRKLPVEKCQKYLQQVVMGSFERLTKKANEGPNLSKLPQTSLVSSSTSDADYTADKVYDTAVHICKNLTRDELKKALMICSPFLTIAPKEVLALAFALRAEIFFRLEDYHFCKLDMNRALKEFRSSEESLLSQLKMSVISLNRANYEYKSEWTMKNSFRKMMIEMYCSELCRKKAELSYHKVECRLLQFFHLKDQTSLLALRTFLVGIKQNLETLKQLEAEYSDVEKSRFHEKQKMFTPSIFSDDYPAIIDLYQRFKNEKAVSSLSTERVEDAVDFVYALKSINFFEPGSFKTLTALELFGAILLLHHTTLLPFDRFDVKARFINRERKLENKKIAIALHRVQTLLNHSCNPQVHVITQNRHGIVFSVRPIKKGEQIFASYCDDYGNATIKERNIELESYGIQNCKCKPCIEKWPKFKGSSLDYDRNLFTTKNPEILEKIKKRHKEFKEWVKDNAIMDVYDDRKLDEAIEQAKIIRKYVQEPSPMIWMCEELIRRCMLSKASFPPVSEAATAADPKQAAPWF